MAAAQDGDRRAMDRLLRDSYDRVAQLCRRLTGNDADAADATQEALIAIARGIHRFEGGSRFSTWAYRVATNAALDELRRRRRRPEPGLPDVETDDLGAALNTVAGGRLGPAGSDRAGGIDAVADRLDIGAALARLPLEFRAAVVLRDLCGLDYAEIAEVLDIPAGTVRSRIARGRSQLAALLEGNPPGTDDRQTTRP